MENPKYSKGQSRATLYKNPDNYPFNCVCGKNFSAETSFKAHKKKFHGDTINSGSSITERNCPLCIFKSHSRPELIKHFETKHGLSPVQEKLDFESENQFLKWKNDVESKTLSRFVRKRGIKKFKTYVMSTYSCHRSGYYTPAGKGIRRLKSQGTVKINSFCPAAITLKITNDGRYHILYTSTHVGHAFEDLPLTPSDEEIARSLKIPLDDIFDELRDSIYDSNVERNRMLTRRDLYNIEEASFSLASKAVRHKNDASIVDSWVKQMKAGDRGCIMLYKPQGIFLEEISNFKSDDFILMIMTSAQLNILKQYGSDCICLDGTPNLNDYDFELYTLLVVDEMQEAFPCAFLISNRSDTQALQFFFAKVKDRAGIIKPNIFMSDLADSFFNAWISEMGMPEKRLYSTWHVDQSWRKNLTKIKGKEAQIKVYKHLRTLLVERDINAFHKMLTEFCSIDNPGYLEFSKYFKESYAKKCEQWAYCYRLDAGINMNMHSLEHMHRSLKYMYLRGKNMKRLDRGIVAIMNFIRDKFIKKLKVITKGKFSSNVTTRHKNMEKMGTNNNIVIKTDQGWEVSTESGFEMYFVQKKEISCNNCLLVCSECQICIHQFQCSCQDSAIKYNLCKHIHLIAKLNKEADDRSESIGEPDNNEDDDVLIVDEQDFLRRRDELIERYMESLNSVVLPKQLEYMERHFLPINSTLAAIKEAYNSQIAPLHLS